MNRRGDGGGVFEEGEDVVDIGDGERGAGEDEGDEPVDIGGGVGLVEDVCDERESGVEETPGEDDEGVGLVVCVKVDAEEGSDDDGLESGDRVREEVWGEVGEVVEEVGRDAGMAVLDKAVAVGEEGAVVVEETDVAVKEEVEGVKLLEDGVGEKQQALHVWLEQAVLEHVLETKVLNDVSFGLETQLEVCDADFGEELDDALDRAEAVVEDDELYELC